MNGRPTARGVFKAYVFFFHVIRNSLPKECMDKIRIHKSHLFINNGQTFMGNNVVK